MYHERILELVKFKNILGFISVVFDTHVVVDSESFFERLVISIAIVDVVVVGVQPLLVPLRLTDLRARKGDSKRLVFYTLRSMPFQLVLGVKTTETVKTDVNYMCV